MDDPIYIGNGILDQIKNFDYTYKYTITKEDHSKGDECKKKIYEEYIKGKYNVDLVFDDSSKVVKMYRDLGLTVLQPNEGKF